MSDNKDFFAKQTDSSRVKAKIISEYFPQYCRIVGKKHTPQMFGYYDMFSGPGIYGDGSLSTPLLVAKQCYEDEFLRQKVWMVFNDMAYGDELKENFEEIYPSGTFEKEPFFANRVFGEWPKIDVFLTRNTMNGFFNDCPSLLFIDPWGYKHINTGVLTQFLTQWGNEVFIFMNTKRLNAAFANSLFQDDLKIIFPLTYDEVKENLTQQRDVEAKHKYIINHLAEEFQRILGGRVFYTAFQFREEELDTPSHYLLHITKGAKGFELIKQVYTKYANVSRPLYGMENVETYTFDPHSIQGMFDEEFKREDIQNLKNRLCEEFRSQRIDADTMFRKHQQEDMHSKSHYLVALRELFEEKKIETYYNDERKHKVPVLISSSCIITFK